MINARNVFRALVLKSICPRTGLPVRIRSPGSMTANSQTAQHPKSGNQNGASAKGRRQMLRNCRTARTAKEREARDYEAESDKS